VVYETSGITPMAAKRHAPADGPFRLLGDTEEDHGKRIETIDSL